MDRTKAVILGIGKVTDGVAHGWHIDGQYLDPQYGPYWINRDGMCAGWTIEELAAIAASGVEPPINGPEGQRWKPSRPKTKPCASVRSPCR